MMSLNCFETKLLMSRQHTLLFCWIFQLPWKEYFSTQMFWVSVEWESILEGFFFLFLSLELRT